MNMSTRLDGDTPTVTDVGLSDVVYDLEAISENLDTTVDGIAYKIAPVEAAAGMVKVIAKDRAGVERHFTATLTEVAAGKDGQK